jgi:putative transposase
MNSFTDTFQPNGYYHVYNHAIGHENLFRQEDNYQYFLKKYAQYLGEVCDTFAYCLMPNHFHLFIRIKNADTLLAFYQKDQQLKKRDVPIQINPTTFGYHELVMLQFKHFLNGYTQAINKRFNRKGGLFLNFLKRKSVETNDYFTALIHYIHLNPVNHGFCRTPLDWTHSSYFAYLSEKTTRLPREETLAWFGDRKGYIEFHNMPLNNNRFSEIEFN